VSGGTAGPLTPVVGDSGKARYCDKLNAPNACELREPCVLYGEWMPEGVEREVGPLEGNAKLRLGSRGWGQWGVV
jgi:hypothetical protein